MDDWQISGMAKGLAERLDEAGIPYEMESFYFAGCAASKEGVRERARAGKGYAPTLGCFFPAILAGMTRPSGSRGGTRRSGWWPRRRRPVMCRREAPVNESPNIKLSRPSDSAAQLLIFSAPAPSCRSCPFCVMNDPCLNSPRLSSRGYMVAAAKRQHYLFVVVIGSDTAGGAVRSEE